MIVRIASEKELTGKGDDKIKTLWVRWFKNNSDLSEPDFYNKKSLIDINRKVELITDEDAKITSKFSYYNSKGKNLLEDEISDEEESETTFVKITFVAKSTNPALKNTAPVIIEAGIRLKNSLPF